MSTDRKRVRVVQYVVQPVLVVDDGADLAPLQIEPLTVPAAEWAGFVESGLTAALSQLEERINEESTDAPPGRAAS